MNFIWFFELFSKLTNDYEIQVDGNGSTLLFMDGTQATLTPGGLLTLFPTDPRFALALVIGEQPLVLHPNFNTVMMGTLTKGAAPHELYVGLYRLLPDGKEFSDGRRMVMPAMALVSIVVA